MAIVLAAAILSGVACSSDDPVPVIPNNEVWMQGTSFQPNSRTVNGGTTVSFVNKDAQPHNITSSSVPAGAATFNQNAAASATVNIAFTVSGTYQYFCSLHGTATTGMRGTVIVN